MQRELSHLTILHYSLFVFHSSLKKGHMAKNDKASQQKNAADQSGRRGFLKGMSLTIAAAGVGATVSSETVAQTPAAPTRPAAASADSKLFHTVETASGKVQGILNAAGI